MSPFQFRLRTLLIVLAVAPPLLAGAWWAWQHHPLLILFWAIALGRIYAEICHERDKYLRGPRRGKPRSAGWSRPRNTPMRDTAGVTRRAAFRQLSVLVREE